VFDVIEFIKANRYLYKLFKGHFFFSPSWMPSKKSYLFITSWGRAGNTYAFFIFKNALPEKIISSHGHNIASLKEAKFHQINSLALIRDPLESISSMYLKRGFEKKYNDPFKGLAVLIESWKKYHQFLLRDEFFSILNFDNFINNPSILIKWHNEVFENPIDDETFQNAIIRAREIIESDNRDPLVRQLSSNEKDILKSELREQIIKIDTENSLNKIYQSLISKATK